METDSEIGATQSSVASDRSSRQTQDDLPIVNGINGHHHEDVIDDNPKEITGERYEKFKL